MFGDEMSKAKASAVIKLNAILDSLEPTVAPGWLVWLMVIPAITLYTLVMVVKAITAMVVMILLNLLKAAFAPILCLALLLDLLLMMGWFFKEAVNKMKGG